jgi:hypothetical protein
MGRLVLRSFYARWYQELKINLNIVIRGGVAEAFDAGEAVVPGEHIIRLWLWRGPVCGGFQNFLVLYEIRKRHVFHLLGVLVLEQSLFEKLNLPAQLKVLLPQIFSLYFFLY